MTMRRCEGRVNSYVGSSHPFPHHISQPVMCIMLFRLLETAHLGPFLKRPGGMWSLHAPASEYHLEWSKMFPKYIKVVEK